MTTVEMARAWENAATVLEKADMDDFPKFTETEISAIDIVAGLMREQADELRASEDLLVGAHSNLVKP